MAKRKRTSLTVERLRQVLHYDALTGRFTWLVSNGPRLAGAAAGSVWKNRYVHIGIDGKIYRAHRLAWLWMTGEWPTDEVDHKNRIGLDNRWDNLRTASRNENMANVSRRVRGALAHRGVYQLESGRWGTRATVNGKSAYFGSFDTQEEAVAHRRAECQRLRGDFYSPE